MNWLGNATATGNVLANVSDIDASDVLRVTSVNGIAPDGMVKGTYGDRVVQEDGSWIYTFDNSDEAGQALT